MNKMLKRHVYTSRGEKIKHFFAGLLVWAVGGGILILNIPPGLDPNGVFFIAFFIGLVIYFTITNYWVAVGLMTNILINLFWGWWLYGFLKSFEMVGLVDLVLPFPLYMLFSIMQ